MKKKSGKRLSMYIDNNPNLNQKTLRLLSSVKEVMTLLRIDEKGKGK